MNDPVVSSTGPAVVTWLPEVPENVPSLPSQVTPDAVAGCPPLIRSGTAVPDDWDRLYQATGPPEPGSVTLCESTFPAGS